MITFMMLAAVIAGLAGIFLLLFGYPLFGVGLMVLGALVFIIANRQWQAILREEKEAEQRAVEERRHQEMLQATREGRQRKP